MKFYLSSYRVGEHGKKLAELSGGGPLAYIPNALDHVPIASQKDSRERNTRDVRELGIAIELLDLKDFFSASASIESALSRFSGVWVTGGNTFVLRQAMKLSGFDEAIKRLASSPFLYAGYSAGVCVLAPDLKPLQIVDRPNTFPYPEISEVIWQGLHFLDYMVLPHYKSDHPESADIDKEVQYCNDNGIPYRTLRDGEALFGENIEVLKREIALKPG